MNMLRQYVAACAVALVPASMAGASVISTFDTDLEGWTYSGDLQQFAHDATGGNPDGYMYLNDAATGAIFFVHAPTKFLGDLSAANGETLSFDVNLLSSARNNPLSEFGTVTIASSSDSASLDLGDIPAADTWTHYSTTLDAATWGKSEADWANLLADVTGISVRLEAINGDEQIGFDNFEIVPEPASLTLLTMGGACLLRRRRV